MLPACNRPHAGQLADALRHHAELAAGANQHLFEQANEVDRPKMRTLLAGKIAAQIDDGVADQLAGAVIGHVAAAIDLVQLHAAAGEQFVAGNDVRAMRVAAQRDDRWMLQQQQRIGDQALLPRCDDPLLDGEAVSVETPGRDGEDSPAFEGRTGSPDLSCID